MQLINRENARTLNLQDYNSDLWTKFIYITILEIAKNRENEEKHFSWVRKKLRQSNSLAKYLGAVLSSGVWYNRVLHTALSSDEAGTISTQEVTLYFSASWICCADVSPNILIFTSLSLQCCSSVSKFAFFTRPTPNWILITPGGCPGCLNMTETSQIF